MVATPKKVLSAVTKRLKRRPTWREQPSDAARTCGTVRSSKTRAVSSGARVRQSSRRLSDVLVQDMHMKMKAAALFSDKDPEGIPLSLTCSNIMLSNSVSDATVELSIQINGKVTTMSVGENVSVRLPSRSSEVTIMVLKKHMGGMPKSTLRDTTFDKPTTPAKILKKKFSTLRTSRREAQESGLIGSAQVMADDLLRPMSGVVDITIMKEGRGKRSIVPLGCVSIKTTTVTEDSVCGSNADIDLALSERDKENMQMEMDAETDRDSKGHDDNLTIVREGFLSLERDSDRTGWKMYWARLLSTGQLLCYQDQFTNKEPGAEEMVFDLGGAAHVTRPPMHEMPSRNGIKVTFADGGEPFYILAETMQECRAWIEALETTAVAYTIAPSA